MSLAIYADFNGLGCYLASRRVDALAGAGVKVDWRAVEHDPHVPVTARRLDPVAEAELKDESAVVAKALLPGETLPWKPPGLMPKTEASVSGYAEAYGAGVADDVRRLLFAAYWVDGADIGSPEILRPLLAGPILRGHTAAEPLRESGYCVSVTRGPITTGAYRRIRTWHEEWRRLGTGVVPTLVEDGRTLAGAAALRRLAEEITLLGVSYDPRDLADPARYPALGVRPPAAWVSAVGGSWAYSLRLP